MDTKITLTSQMEAAQKAMTDLLNSMNSGRLAMLQGFAESQKRAAHRLAEIEKVLIEEGGDKDPDVIAIRKEKEQNLRVANAYSTLVKRAQSIKLSDVPGEIFLGNVRTASDAVAQGIMVRLVAKLGEKERTLGEASTNEFGDYAIQIPARDLDPKAELSVHVANELGEKLVSQRVDRTPAGGATLLPLKLAARPATVENSKPPEGTVAPKKPSRTGKATRSKRS